MTCAVPCPTSSTRFREWSSSVWWTWTSPTPPFPGAAAWSPSGPSSSAAPAPCQSAGSPSSPPCPPLLSSNPFSAKEKKIFLCQKNRQNFTALKYCHEFFFCQFVHCQNKTRQFAPIALSFAVVTHGFLAGEFWILSIGHLSSIISHTRTCRSYRRHRGGKNTPQYLCGFLKIIWNRDDDDVVLVPLHGQCLPTRIWKSVDSLFVKILNGHQRGTV